MTLKEAAAQGISRVRLTRWGFPEAYMRIHIVPGMGHGPWGHLFSRREQDAIGETTPQEVMLLADQTDEWVRYDGPLDAGDEADR